MIKIKDARTNLELRKAKKKREIKKVEKSELRLIPNTSIKKALLDEGVNDKKIAKRINEGLDALRPAKYSVKGDIIAEEVPDQKIRQEYVDIVLKIFGHYAPEKSQVEKRTIVLNITPELLKGLIDAKAITPEEVKELEHYPIRNGNN